MSDVLALNSKGSFYRFVCRAITSLAVVLLVALPAQAQTYPTDPVTGLPQLSSNATASGSLYLDFDGGVVTVYNSTLEIFENITFNEYGGNSTFNATEQNQIYETWKDVSAHFAMFDVNVTTIAPDKSTTPTGHLLLSDNFNRAWAYLNTFGRTDTKAWGGVQSSWLRGRSTVATHELGHILGAEHQMQYDGNGDYVDDYRGADSFSRGPLMGTDFAGSKYAMWDDEYTGGDPERPQDPKVLQSDIAVIVNTLITKYDAATGGTYSAGGGDGFRVDEHGNTDATATALALNGTENVTATGEGIIERYSDIDMFELVWGGGDLTMTAEAVKHLDADQTYASSLGMTLAMYDSSGSLVGQDGSINVADVNAEVSFAGLAADTYYFAVSSNGDYEDLGAYELSLSGTQVPEPTSLAILALGGLLIVRRRRRA